MSWDVYKEYLYLFPVSVQKGMRTTVGSYKQNNRYVFSDFHYNHDIIIDVWDLKNSANLVLDDAILHKPTLFNPTEKRRVGILFPDTLYEIVLKWRYNFDDGEINVNPGKRSEIDSVFSTPLYKRFIG
ncbi:MAG TPA: hypothetical protein VE870_03375 [Bacteroidales bacterium]|nr:hypothetical protein [Bacteroidales bacterium]